MAAVCETDMMAMGPAAAMGMGPGSSMMMAPSGAVTAQAGPSPNAPAGCTTVIQAAQTVPDLSTFANYIQVYLRTHAKMLSILLKMCRHQIDVSPHVCGVHYVHLQIANNYLVSGFCWLGHLKNELYTPRIHSCSSFCSLLICTWRDPNCCIASFFNHTNFSSILAEGALAPVFQAFPITPFVP